MTREMVHILLNDFVSRAAKFNLTVVRHENAAVEAVFKQTPASRSRVEKWTVFKSARAGIVFIKSLYGPVQISLIIPGETLYHISREVFKLKYLSAMKWKLVKFNTKTTCPFSSRYETWHDNK